MEVSDITKRFGEFAAVDHIRFAVKGSKVLGFMRPNGSDKSTATSMMTDDFPPTGGRVTMCGFDIDRRRGDG